VGSIGGKMKLLFLALACMLLPYSGFARAVGDLNDPVLSSYYVQPKDQSTMRKIASLFEVEHRHGAGYEIIVPAHRAAELLALAPEARLLEHDINAKYDRLNGDWMKGYHDFTSVESHLRRIVAEHPEIATLEEYGKSKEGRPLFVLKLSDNVAQDETESEVMMTSSTHGDELISVEVLFGILDALVAGYGNDTRITRMIDEHELFFIPVVNPDGYTRKSRYANGVDPNRDYPWPNDPSKSPNECIKAVMSFFQGRDIKGSIDYHASGGMVMYPWAYTSQSVPSIDERKFASLTAKMAATNGYQHGQIPDLLYTAQGSSADYYYWKKASISLGLEIGDSKIPSSSSIPRYVKENLEAAFLFIEAF